MRYLVITAACLAACLCAAPSCLAGDVVQICCYSTSPADYAPNCYKCPSNVYASTLLACVNATEMPSNITFKQATCVEKNCAINYPQPESEDNNSLARYSNLVALFGQIGQLLQGGSTPAAARVRREAPHVVRRVETFVTGLGALEFGEPEYM